MGNYSQFTLCEYSKILLFSIFIFASLTQNFAKRLQITLWPLANQRIKRESKFET